MWLGGLLLLVGIFILYRRYAFHEVYGAVVFLLLFALGGSLVSRQLAQSEYIFPTAKADVYDAGVDLYGAKPDLYATRPNVYQITLAEHPEIKERSVMFRAVLQGEVRADTFLQNTRKTEFLLYFPKDSTSSTLRRGDKLLINTRLVPPANNGNPDEFDYARYLKRKGISGTAYVAAGHWQVVGQETSRTLRQVALDYREKVVGYYRHLGFRGDELAVLSALTVGDKDELSEDIMETYSVAGASHVLALSGLHIGFLYALFLFFFSPLWKRWSFLKPFLLLLTIVCLWGFAFFTGLSSSVIRAVTMCSLLILSMFQSEKPLTLNTLAATAFLMLLYNPAWLFDVGFQSSFSAVAAILIFQPRIYGLCTMKNYFLRKIWGLVTISIAAQVGTAPIVALYFSRFSTHFLLTNLWVIPCVSLVMYAAVLLFVFAPFPRLATSLGRRAGSVDTRAE